MATFLNIRYALAFWLYLVFLTPICKSTYIISIATSCFRLVSMFNL